GRYLDQVPTDPSARRAWLRQYMDVRMRRDADRYRDLLIARYGEQAGRAVQYAEAFEGCEYGAPLTEQNIGRLFPF
ncbi:MAG: PIG-L family deacetylase, partial [Roseiflexaceae bacterium]